MAEVDQQAAELLLVGGQHGLRDGELLCTFPIEKSDELKDNPVVIGSVDLGVATLEVERVYASGRF